MSSPSLCWCRLRRSAKSKKKPTTGRQLRSVGKNRREKNYLDAHGGPARLPPPPDRSKQDDVPSKLLILMNYTSPSPHDSTKQVVEKKEKIKKSQVDVAATESDGDDSVVERKKKKRKRNQMTDLRFENELAELDGRSKRKERKKKYWEAKKQKKNQGKTEDTLREK